MDNTDDPFSLTQAQIIERLEQRYGVEDAANMEENERMCLFLSLIVEDEDLPVYVPGEAATEDDDTRQTIVTSSAPDIVSDTAAPKKDEAGLILSLCDISGTDPESAKHLLEAMDWDLTAAVTMCMEGLDLGKRSPVRTPQQDGQDTQLVNVSGGLQSSARTASFTDVGEGTWRDVDPLLEAQQQEVAAQGPQGMTPNGWMTQQPVSRSVWGDIMMAGGGLGHHFVGGGEGSGYGGNFGGNTFTIISNHK